MAALDSAVERERAAMLRASAADVPAQFRTDHRSHTGSFRSGIGTVTPAHRLSLCACRHAGAYKDALSTSHALLSRKRGGFLFSLPMGFHQASLPYACRHAGAYREHRPLSIHVWACRHAGAHACYKKINGLEL